MLRLGGASLDALAKQFGVSRDSIWRHFERGHVSDKRKAELLAGPAAVADLANRSIEESRSLLDYLTIVRSVAFAAFLNAAESGDHIGVAHLSGKLLDTLDRIGRLTGELRALGGLTITNQFNFLADPRYLELQRGLVAVARAHPAARADVVALLRRIDTDASAASSGPMIEGSPSNAA